MRQHAAQRAQRTRLANQLADDLGFALFGVAPAEPTPHDAYIEQWLSAGKHGEMRYLDENIDKRTDPRELLPGAKSVICVADRYVDPERSPTSEHSTTSGQSPASTRGATDATGRLPKYALGDDYHRVIKKRLFQIADALAEHWPGHDFKTCVDTVPTLDREHAARAGLGWIAKHTLLIHPHLGSYLLLGEIVTTLDMATTHEHASQPEATRPDSSHSPHPTPHTPTSHCGACTRCIDACPTDCITPYQLDASACISYLTIEHRSLIDPTFFNAIDNWIAGCDICQDVCPYNQPERLQRLAGNAPPHPRHQPRVPDRLPLLDILDWTPDDRSEAFAGTALKRIKLDMLKRNALIALGNHIRRTGDEHALERITQVAEDLGETDLVRQTAQQVLDFIASPYNATS